MTQEDKELLIKDLSARLQYNVQVLTDIDKTFEGGVISTLKVINLKKDWIELQSVLTPFKFDEIKPYLRPMSSMTEEEYEELLERLPKYWSIDINKFGLYFDIGDASYPDIDLFVDTIDWLKTHHFDYRGLIEKGLAIEVTENNNPYET